MKTTALALTLLAAAPLAHAADSKPASSPANPISSSLTQGYQRIGKVLLASAELMPEADYAFKPTPEVRSFGQLIGHVANAQYMFCSSAKHEAAPKKPDAEKLATKAELKKALADAISYCDTIYQATTDATLTQPAELFGNKMMKFNALMINVAHDNEHYGNIVTYLRIKKLVPPTSKGN
jgi:uncharacterized damage-inducible protein DinB